MNPIARSIFDLTYRADNRLREWMETARMEKVLSKVGSIGKDVTIRPPVTIHRPDKLHIGDGVMIEPNLFASCGGELVIDEGTGIGKNCRIITTHHDVDNLDALLFSTKFIHKEVHICRHVFIAIDVIILPGVTIGEGAVIGANAVVTKDVPPLAIVGGNPARVIRHRDREAYERILKSEKKRIRYIRGEVMPARELRAHVKRYGKQCREHLKNNELFYFTDTNCRIEEKKRIQVMYYIAAEDPELEFTEHGDSYAISKKSPASGNLIDSDDRK